ncbi:amidohydrolase family protein, partial [Phytoactinopolyspora halotolerans]
GAHVVPPEYRDSPEIGSEAAAEMWTTPALTRRRSEYIELVVGPMLQACAPYARWADVFCEPGAPTAFDGDESRTILQAAAQAGLGLRVHAGQLGTGPGVALGVELGAASVDHCTHLTDADVDLLADAARAAERATVATLLPGVEFSTKSPYPDARRLIDAGVPVALATDCNPGTSFTSSMPFCIALAVREMRMTPGEALWSATVGGARALRRHDVGHLSVGARPDLCVLDAPSHLHLAYRPGVPIASALTTATPR